MGGFHRHFGTGYSRDTLVEGGDSTVGDKIFYRHFDKGMKLYSHFNRGRRLYINTGGGGRSYRHSVGGRTVYGDLGGSLVETLTEWRHHSVQLCECVPRMDLQSTVLY